MTPKVRERAVLAVIALGVFASGVAFAIAEQLENVEAVSAISLTLGTSIGVLTATLARWRHAQTDADLAEREWEETRRVSSQIHRDREAYVASSRARDYLNVLINLLEKEDHRAHEEPPVMALHALAEIKEASRVLIALGSLDDARELDEHTRSLLEYRGSTAWLTFLPYFESVARRARDDDTILDRVIWGVVPKAEAAPQPEHTESDPEARA